MPSPILARADALMKLGEFERALKDYSSAIEHRNLLTGGSVIFKKRVTAAIQTGDYRQAYDDLKGLTRMLEPMPDAFAMLAMILARSPDKSIRDPEAALDYAKYAAKINEQPSYDFLVELALAAAYSANGNFEQAVAHQEMAIAAMRAEPSADVKAQLEAFKAGNDYPFQKKPVKRNANQPEQPE